MSRNRLECPILVGGGGHSRVIEETGVFIGSRVGHSKELPRRGVRGGSQITLYLGIGLARADVYEDLVKRRFRVLAVVAPTAYYRGPLLGGLQIMLTSVVRDTSSLSENVLVNTGAIIEHDCRIGKHSVVGPGAVLCGGVVVGERVLIGPNATILPGVKIGDRATLGAGSVLTHDLPAGETWWGVPARRVR